MAEAKPHNDTSLDGGTLTDVTAFLSLAEQWGDLPASLTSNLRSAIRKVAEIVHLNDNQDLREVNQDDVFRRFHTLAKASLRDGTRATYEKRTRDALDRYRKFLADDATWKQVTASSKPRRTKPMTEGGTETTMATVTVMPNSTKMVSVPVPLRHDVMVHLSLPADLTHREAKRVARIIEAYGGGGQLELPPGTGTEG
jgi:hypothetical protein